MEYQNKTKTPEIGNTAFGGGPKAIQLQDNRAKAAAKQLRADASPQAAPAQRKHNATGLPDSLKSGIENLSGYAMDDVKVHYNSDKPSQLNAHAYAQGTNIHIAPGQEKHLPHEAWHIVQQKQGRVKPTMQMKGKVNVNDDKTLEKEADVMGAKAMQFVSGGNTGALKKVSNVPVVQKKGRIDTSKIVAPSANRIDYENLKKRTEEKIQILRAERKSAKIEATQEWAASQGKDDNRDEKYNATIADIRKRYEEGILAINKRLKELGISDAYISGEGYYGTPTTAHGKVYKRADNGKEYVKDMRGTFVPRYVRRELNRNDKVDSDIVPTGLSTYGEILDKGKVPDIEGHDPTHKLSWEHREFLQQSRGGGGNQFAFSHTSTKRPILSNDHKSFGTHPNGAILTDLSQLDSAQVAAQWQIDPTTGHKILIGDDKHSTLGNRERFKERDKTVRMSGYRNMEVVTASIPAAAIAKKPTADGWSGTDWDGVYKKPTNSEVKKALKNHPDRFKGNGELRSFKGMKKILEKEAERENEENAVKAYESGTSKRGEAMVRAREELESRRQ